MPVLRLPDDFTEQLEQSESGTINNTDGPGVAVYWKLDGTARADIYIGLILDGLKNHQNISEGNPDSKWQFSISPDISCINDLVFHSDEDELISIKVSRTYLLCYLSAKNFYN